MFSSIIERESVSLSNFSLKCPIFQIFRVFQNANFMWKIVRGVDSESKTLEIEFITSFLTILEKVENPGKWPTTTSFDQVLEHWQFSIFIFSLKKHPVELTLGSEDADIQWINKKIKFSMRFKMDYRFFFNYLKRMRFFLKFCFQNLPFLKFLEMGFLTE